MKSRFSSRGIVVAFFIMLFAFIMISKLFLVQVVHGSVYKENANRQYATPSSSIFERGTIFFETKSKELRRAATQTLGFKVAINPEEVKDIDYTYEKLSSILTLDKGEFNTKASKKNDPYEEVANRIEKEDADKISALKVPGVYVYKEKWRFYPGANLASNTIGLVGYKGDELGGRYGLERQYDDVLTKNKETPYVNFFAEVFSNINKTILGKDDNKDGDIVTTIEPSVEEFLDTKLKDVKEKYSIDSIGGIIINPMDGSVYAMSTKPDFDPNDFSKVKNTSIFANPMVENVLEFGSVVKPLIMASALDAGVVTANTTYTDNGFVTVDKKQIYNFDKKGRGPNTSMQDVLNQSLNTGMVFVYNKLGKTKMRDYLYSFGINEKTGIDLPNETNSLTSNLHSPRDIEYANASFGQGIAMTPVQIVRALSSLANGGKLITPHLVDRIKYDDGSEKKLVYPTLDTNISKQTSEEITRMLVKVMDDSLKNGNAKFEHFSVAVKTGTAQVADLNNGGYYEDRHTHSFFGYFPAYDPKFLVFLYAVNPKGVPYSAQTWADPFLDIAKFLLNYYEVPPDR